MIPDVSIYIPSEESRAEAAAKGIVKIGSTVVRPLTIGLMMASLPVAVALVKILQALDYLDMLNINNMPSNIRFILDLVGEGNFIGNLLDPIKNNFWNFEDPAMGESNSSGNKDYSNLFEKSRLLNENSNERN